MLLLTTGWFLACQEQNQGVDDSGIGESDDVLETALDQMTGAAIGENSEAHPGEILYQEHCAACHQGETTRAPHKMFLEMLSPAVIVRTMNEGVMQQQAKNLSTDEKFQLAEYLTGVQAAQSAYKLKDCEVENLQFDYEQPPFASGWGIDPGNSRYIQSEVAGLPSSDVSRLRLKWAFAYPGATRARSQPSYAGGAIYVGSQDGTVYSLDADSGCVRWTFAANAEVRTGITFTPWRAGELPDQHPSLYFADLLARVYALDAVTGNLIWSTKVDQHPSATVTAQPVLYKGHLLVTVSSLEVVPAADPGYACCTFRGSVTRLNAATGEQEWKSYTIQETPTEVGRNTAGTPMLAPSGAPSWNSPTVDEIRQSIYVGTGENYSSPAQGSSDAIIAFNLVDGTIKWIHQTTPGDAWNLACMPFIVDQTNCPVENGPDVDFAAPPILIRGSDQDILVAGQKSGDVWGLNPDTGDQIWHTKAGRGGNQGGIHFGMAAEGETVFVPMSDYDDSMLPVEESRPGLYAYNAWDGKMLWESPTENICGDRANCDPGISAAITAIEGIVFAGHMDGRLRAYDSQNGQVVWEIDTTQLTETLSGEIAHGGSMGGGSGPMIVNGMLYMNSGYGLYFHMPGNVLLAFSVDGK